MKNINLFISIIVILSFLSCGSDNETYEDIDPYKYTKLAFGANINPNNLANYANQSIPSYILIDNTDGNPITDKGATLGRVLFYDKNLSSNNTISCASCHKQEFAFGDTAPLSQGVNGLTFRHSMRLVNNRFSQESKYFWDERASTLENQTTMPIKDHGEMGFSGENGDPDFSDLITKLSDIGYYKELFNFVYGSEEITEYKIQLALAQFIRSIQSFDSKFDIGKANAQYNTDPFFNYSPLENHGKNLFITEATFDINGERNGGGLSCTHCHHLPTFSIDATSKNNGVIGVSGNPTLVDLNNTKSPTLRDLFNNNGVINGPLMHTGSFTLEEVFNHYSTISYNPLNTNLDNRFFPTGTYLKMIMTRQERDAVTAFLKTLSGSNMYTDAKWSNPFLD